jgi:hypothetical protein
VNTLTPDWLTRRRGDVRPAEASKDLIVYFDGKQQYYIGVVPVKGVFSWKVTQSINGVKLTTDAVFDSEEQALRAALESLRSKLGW